MKVLVIVDMQNDFIYGSLGTPEARAIVPIMVERLKEYEQEHPLVLFTKDTHYNNYMDTQEGKNLPVPHCIKGTDGWQIHPSLDALRKTEAIDKITFGSTELVEVLAREKDIELAVTAAVWVHSAAGDMAAKRLSQTSMLPSDMIDELPCLFKKLEG